MLQGRRRDPESERQAHPEQPAHDREQRVVMDGVRDRIHQLAADGWRQSPARFVHVVHLAADVNRQLERERRNLLTRATNAPRFCERKLPIVLDPRIAPTMIVVHFAIGARPSSRHWK